MRAMVFHQSKTPLRLENLPIPQPRKGEVLIKIEACGVCRTDLHIWKGELSEPKLPLILGHQIIGTIQNQNKEERNHYAAGTRVGVPWLGKTCGNCSYCLSGKENLCEHSLFTGYQINGGFAEYCVADERYIFPIPIQYSSAHAAPLLCAGLIGFRSLRFAKQVKRLGFYGFGSAAHILIQIARDQGTEIWAFTRSGDEEAKKLAYKLGAVWAGDATEKSPIALDAAIIFAPAGNLVPLALQAVRKGGSVICAGIHMSDIPSFPYSYLYGERILRSVTNLTRKDGQDFFELLKNIKVETVIHSYPLEKANEALIDLEEGKISGSAVLVMD